LADTADGEALRKLIAELPVSISVPNFREAEYIDKQGKPRKMIKFSRLLGELGLDPLHRPRPDTVLRGNPVHPLSPFNSERRIASSRAGLILVRPSTLPAFLARARPA